MTWLRNCSLLVHEDPQTVRRLILNDLVGHQCQQLACFGRQHRVNCSPSVEDANHVRCASHDASYTSLAGQTDARIQGNRRYKSSSGCLYLDQDMDVFSSRDGDVRFN